MTATSCIFVLMSDAAARIFSNATGDADAIVEPYHFRRYLSGRLRSHHGDHVRLSHVGMGETLPNSSRRSGPSTRRLSGVIRASMIGLDSGSVTCLRVRHLTERSSRSKWRKHPKVADNIFRRWVARPRRYTTWRSRRLAKLSKCGPARTPCTDRALPAACSFSRR